MGLGKAYSCQPDADSFANVPVPKSVPPEVQRLARWVPVLVELLKKRMAAMKPPVSAVNLTPSSTAAGSLTATVPGVAPAPQMLMPPDDVIVIVTPADGVSRLPLSSTARLRMVAVPMVGGDQV